MSVFVSSIIWRHFPGGTELKTALALADIADDKGYCIYADTDAASLAKKTIQTERSVRYHIKAMQEIGWLQIVNQGGGRGNKLQYRIPVELVPLGAAGRVQKLPPFTDSRTALDDQPQDLVSKGPETLQKLPPSSDSTENPAVCDTKVAIHDTKGGNPRQPLIRGTSVHKNNMEGAARPHSIPEGFQISENVRAWAKKKGFEQYLEAHFEWFVDYAKARPTKVKYSDWDAAFRTCVTSDWGEIRKNWKSRPRQQEQERTCTYRTDRTGGVCGMPAMERFGGDDLCSHHKEKILHSGPIPAEAKAKLEAFLKRKPSVMA